MIRIENLNKYFNKGKRNQIHVIDNTNIELPDKGLVALLGPSGCGKTTLLNAIGGLDKVNKGNIYINDYRITKKCVYNVDKIRNLKIGYIFQDYKLVDNMSVYDNIAMVLKMIGIKDKNEIKKRVEYILDRVSMYRYRYRPCGMLSGGERQRVGIARALVKNPDIILADEPTGNLDSKNTIEIMNIIKSISRDKLVILVTHEVDLAKFYADRILEVLDGKIVKDYKNKDNNNLDYRIDNKFYLKDFKYHMNNNDSDINVDYYTDNKNKLNLVIVCKNGNLYIKNKDNEKIEVIDSSSSIEFVNDKYKSMDKSIYLKYSFDFDKIINKDIKLKYSSIFNIFNIFSNGFKRVLNYSFVKKLLLVGFFLSSLFVTYSVSNVIGLKTVRDDEFVTIDKNYLMIENNKNTISKFLEYEKVSDVLYVIPSKKTVGLKIDTKDYYQLIYTENSLAGSLITSSILDEDDIVYGRLPKEENEIVIDEWVYDLANRYGELTTVGLYDYEHILDRKVTTMNGSVTYTIVGVCNRGSYSIYVNDNQFYNILTNNTEDAKRIYDYNLYSSKMTIVKGNIPNNDYEVVVPEVLKDSYTIGKNIDDLKVNGNKLLVVGYYKSDVLSNSLFTNSETVKYDFIENSNSVLIYPKDKDKAIHNYKEINANIVDVYDVQKKEYINSEKDSVNSSLVVAVIILIISLIEIVLIMRSSFLSRIKEVGIYRAIGVKKGDIYKMFIGESFAITTMISVPGVLFMSYCLHVLNDISYFSNSFVMNYYVVLLCILLQYLFNLVVGLIPVFITLRKTPAAILARYDID